MEDGNFEHNLVDKIHTSTAVEKGSNDKQPNWNYPFRYSFAHFNEYGPQLVDEIHLLETMVSMFEDESKMKPYLQSLANGGKYVLFSAGSINGKMLDSFLVKKQRQIMVNEQVKKSGGSFLDGLLGGGGGQKEPKPFG